MKTNVLKLAKSKNYSFRAFLIAMMLGVFASFIIGAHIIYSAHNENSPTITVDGKRSDIIITYSELNNNVLENYLVNKNFITILSYEPICTQSQVQKMVNVTNEAIGYCNSYQIDNIWINNIRTYKGDGIINLLGDVFFCVTVVILLVVAFLLLKLRWIMPYFELRRYAKELGLNFSAKPINSVGWPMDKRVSETFQFMQNRLTNVVSYQNKLLAMACHDIKTPLTKMQSRRYGCYDELAEKDLVNIKEISQILYSMIEFSKENWIDGTAFKKVSIISLMESIAESPSGNCQFEIINETGDNKLEIYLKLAAFRRAVINIIENAIKHSSKIKILLLKSKKKSVIIKIIDNGGGISEELMQRVFEPFCSQDFSKGGSGLGLYIAKEVINGHDGEISLRNIGNGLEVSIEI